MKYYMHTLDGKPAEYRDGWISFAGKKVRLFARDLKTIKRQQARNIKNRESRGYFIKFDYGYHIIYLPDSHEA